MGENHEAFIEAYQSTLDIRVAAKKAEFPLVWCDRTPPQDYYVYGLIDPITDELFYIGKGKGKRWQAHEKYFKADGQATNKRKLERISAIYGQGFLNIPILNIAHGLTKHDALTLEAKFIKELKQHLTNSSPWIRSIQWAERAKAKHLAQVKKRFARELFQYLGNLKKLQTWLAMPEHDKLFETLQVSTAKHGLKRLDNAGTQEYSPRTLCASSSRG